MAFTHLEQMSYKTGLTEDTCLDLLNKGWAYIEKLGEPSQWVSPLVGMQNLTVKVTRA